MSRKKKSPEKRSVKKTEERDPSPFDNIVLKEKKEPEKKKAPQKSVAKKPGEIVQGYVPSASFADILDSFEKTGNPYRLPKSTASSSKASFGDILDQWEGKKSGKKEKKKEVEAPRPQYKATKSFSDILDQWEGNVRKENKNKKSEEKPPLKKEEKVEGTPLFYKDEDDEKPSPDAVWSVLGGVNKNYVRKTEEKKEEKREEKPQYKRSVPQYSPSRSFADILSDYEGAKVAKEKKKEEEKPSVEIKKAEEECTRPKEKDFFLEKDEDHVVSDNVVWSVIGGKNENFVRKEDEKKDEEIPPQEEKSEEEKPSVKPYVPTKSFSEILSDYEKSVESKEETVNVAPPVFPEPFEAPESDGLFIKETEDEKVAPNVVWSIMGGINENFVRKEEEKKEEVSTAKRNETIPRSTKPYEPKKKFSSLLSSFEKTNAGYQNEKTFDEILKEKGDNGRPKAREYSLNELRSMNPQSTLDLHGENKAQSEEEVRSFVLSSRESGLRKISIITGKGLHSQDGQGVLRSVVESVLKEFDFISEVSNAPLNKGGSGALWIILKDNDK